jgi:hypothetical protein
VPHHWQRGPGGVKEGGSRGGPLGAFYEAWGDRTWAVHGERRSPVALFRGSGARVVLGG